MQARHLLSFIEKELSDEGDVIYDSCCFWFVIDSIDI